MLENFEILFLKTFIFVPFVLSLAIALLSFIKNPIYIRRIAKFFFSATFLLSFLLIYLTDNTSFDILNINFVYDKSASLFIFISNLIFLLFSFISKSFISKLHKVFYSTLMLLSALLNTVILSDNISLTLILIFWIILIGWLYSVCWNKNLSKKELSFQLISNVFWYICAIILIFVEFARYFIVNEISLNFSLINKYIYNINDTSITLAFVGFFILIFKFYNLIPFSKESLDNCEKTSPFIFSINSIISIILGSFFLIKTYLIFDYVIYQHQDFIAIYLLINFIYFLLLSFRQDNFIKFLICAGNVVLLNGFFLIFSFEDETFVAFVYYLLIYIASMSFSYFVFTVLSNKFKTNQIEEIKKYTSISSLVKFFIFTSLINFARIPLLPLFTSGTICFLVIFSTSYENIILNIAPYILIFGVLILSLNSFNIIYKILIEPTEKSKSLITFSRHQIMPILILVFLLILLGLFPQYIFEQFVETFSVGGF